MRHLVFQPRLTPIGINIRIRVLPRLGAIRLWLETWTELIVVVGVLILLIHRRISTLRLVSVTLLLRRLCRRWLPRHLRIDRRIISIDRLPGLIMLSLVHKHLVGQSRRD